MTRWWTRWQMAASLMSVSNFILLIISASPIIGKFLGCRAIYAALFVPPVVICGVLILGWWLDTRFKLAQKMDQEAVRRSPTWGRLFEQLDRLERLIPGDRPFGLGPLRDLQVGEDVASPKTKR